MYGQDSLTAVQAGILYGRAFPEGETALPYEESPGLGTGALGASSSDTLCLCHGPSVELSYFSRSEDFIPSWFRNRETIMDNTRQAELENLRSYVKGYKDVSVPINGGFIKDQSGLGAFGAIYSASSISTLTATTTLGKMGVPLQSQFPQTELSTQNPDVEELYLDMIPFTTAQRTAINQDFQLAGEAAIGTEIVRTGIITTFAVRYFGNPANYNPTLGTNGKLRVPSSPDGTNFSPVAVSGARSALTFTQTGAIPTGTTAFKISGDFTRTGGKMRCDSGSCPVLTGQLYYNSDTPDTLTPANTPLPVSSSKVRAWQQQSLKNTQLTEQTRGAYLWNPVDILPVPQSGGGIQLFDRNAIKAQLILEQQAAAST